jgi:putative hydrolase of the HAD superfamily
VGLVIFDAFNTLVTAHPEYRHTFLEGLARAGLEHSPPLLSELQAASEGIDHSARSRSRDCYVAWAAETLRLARQPGQCDRPGFAARIVPALEQLHQAPMIQMPGAENCLARLKTAGYQIAVCSNWGWDLDTDLQPTGLAGHIDTCVPSAQVGFRKPHVRIYQAALDASDSRADSAVFIGDNFRTDVMGPQSVGIRSILLASLPTAGFDGEHAQSLTAVAELLVGQLRRPGSHRFRRTVYVPANGRSLPDGKQLTRSRSATQPPLWLPGRWRPSVHRRKPAAAH